jgi:Zn-dependent protease
MSDGPAGRGAAESETERRLRNLRAVARHVAEHGETAAPRGAAVEQPVRPAGTAGSRAGRWARWGTAGAVIAFLAGKLKIIVPLLKFAKLGTLLSMVLAIWVYAQIWGLAFAVGFVLLLFVHELGHALVMRRQGIPAGAPVFIPFLGAVIAMRGLPRNAYVEALVGIGGPVLGSAGAFACLLVGWATGSLFWYALASTGFLLNLFNLLPISPLDGGRIVGVISRWFWAVGYAIGIAMFAVTRHPLLFLILLFGLLGLGQAIRGPRPGYYDVAPAKRVAMGAAYFGLAALLALAMRAAEAPLEGLGS